MLKTRENALKDGQVADGDEREDLEDLEEEERKGFTHDIKIPLWEGILGSKMLAI